MFRITQNWRSKLIMALFIITAENAGILVLNDIFFLNLEKIAITEGALAGHSQTRAKYLITVK